jgi:hypothetical protein
MPLFESKEESSQFLATLALNPTMETGAPSFRGMYRQLVQSDYTFLKALKEFVDNVITKCSKIYINSIVVKDKLLSVTISDNYSEGFKHLHKQGSDNPLNLAHIRDGQTDDNEQSQFGIGFKAGSMSTCHKMTIITKTDEAGCTKVISDYIRMNEQDTFNSQIFPISPQEYASIHPFEYGTTIILDNIRENICGKMSEQQIKELIINELSSTYNYIICEQNKEIYVSVNGKEEKINYKEPFNRKPKCIPFTKSGTVYKCEYNEEILYYNQYDDNTIVIYNNSLNKLYTEHQTLKIMKEIKDKVKIAVITTTFVYFQIIDPITKLPYESEKDTELPFGKIDIFRIHRQIGTWRARGRNGSKNYTQTEIHIDSKKIAEEIGLTFNKNVSEDHSNDLTKSLREFVKDMTKPFNADTTTSQYIELEKIAKKHNLFVPIQTKALPSTNDPTVIETQQAVSMEEAILVTETQSAPSIDDEPTLYIETQPAPSIDDEPTLYTETQPAPSIDDEPTLLTEEQDEQAPSIDDEPTLYTETQPAPSIDDEPTLYTETQPAPSIDDEPTLLTEEQDEQAPSIDDEPTLYTETQPAPSMEESEPDEAEPVILDTENSLSSLLELRPQVHVKPHIRGNLTSEQYDSLIEYLIKEKLHLLQDPRSTQVFNIIFR